MKDRYRFEIKDGFYRDEDDFHYYHIKKTPKGFMKREANEEDYSLLGQTFASTLLPLNRQDELIKLIISVEIERLQTSPECTEQFGEFAKDWVFDRAGHRVRLKNP